MADRNNSSPWPSTVLVTGIGSGIIAALFFDWRLFFALSVLGFILAMVSSAIEHGGSDEG